MLYRPHIRLADTHYPVFHTLPGIIPLKVSLLLAVHPDDDFNITLLSGCQHLRRLGMLPIHPAYLFQYLPQKVKQASGYLPGLDLRAPALFPVCKVGPLNIQILCPRPVQVQLFTHHTHYPVTCRTFQHFDRCLHGVHRGPCSHQGLWHERFLYGHIKLTEYGIAIRFIVGNHFVFTVLFFDLFVEFKCFHVARMILVKPSQQHNPSIRGIIFIHFSFNLCDAIGVVFLAYSATSYAGASSFSSKYFNAASTDSSAFPSLSRICILNQ